MTERWERSGAHAVRINAAIRAWAAAQEALLAPTGRIPDWAREGWVAATGGVSVPERPLRRNVGQTAAAQAYRLLHAGLAQAVADGLITANPCAIKGAGSRDARDRVDRRTVTAQEMWALADAMPERCPASVIVAFCSGLRAGELFALQRKHVDLDAGLVRVEQSLAAPRTGQGWFSAPKTRAGKRSVVLPGVAVGALRDHMEEFTPPGGDARRPARRCPSSCNAPATRAHERRCTTSTLPMTRSDGSPSGSIRSLASVRARSEECARTRVRGQN